eukprot:434938-Prymnesium_polylepis.1
MGWAATGDTRYGDMDMSQKRIAIRDARKDARSTSTARGAASRTSGGKFRQPVRLCGNGGVGGSTPSTGR